MLKKLFVVVLLCSAVWAKDNSDRRSGDVDRLRAAGEILNDIMAAPDKGIPEEIIGKADCLAIVPSLKKGGFIVGGSYGKGVATCRLASGWSAPVFFRMEGGSVGFQIGAQEVDLIMVIMNSKGMTAMLHNKAKLGADVSAAAGPVGRHAEGMTDWKLRAQVLTYSRARGLFAGVSLEGSSIRQDNDDTRAFYGRMVPYSTSLAGNIAAPADSQGFLAPVAKYAGAGAETEKPAEAKTAPAPSAAPTSEAKPEPAPAPNPQMK
ncbi:MAG: YSC84-related protein [Terriglobales bacterium]|jgi:SH3 domain-containing YSC84-like protein 1